MCAINRILMLSKNAGMTQAALADKINELKLVKQPITKQTITDWKSGKSKSYFELIPGIADYFGVSCDYILKGKEYISNNTLQSEELSLIAEYKKLDFKGRSAVASLIVEEQERMEVEKSKNGTKNFG